MVYLVCWLITFLFFSLIGMNHLFQNSQMGLFLKLNVSTVGHGTLERFPFDKKQKDV